MRCGFKSGHIFKNHEEVWSALLCTLLTLSYPLLSTSQLSAVSFIGELPYNILFGTAAFMFRAFPGMTSIICGQDPECLLVILAIYAVSPFFAFALWLSIAHLLKKAFTIARRYEVLSGDGGSSR